MKIKNFFGASYIVIIAIIAMVVLDFTYAADAETMLKISKSNLTGKVDFNGNGKLYPGGRVDQEFIIQNGFGQNVELDGVSVGQLTLTHNGETIAKDSEIYQAFIENVSFKLIHNFVDDLDLDENAKERLFFDAKFKDLLNNTLYKPSVQVYFNTNSQGTFKGIIAMAPEANDLLQNINATFDYSFVFSGSDLSSGGEGDDGGNTTSKKPKKPKKPVEPPKEEEPKLVEPEIVPEPEPEPEPQPEPEEPIIIRDELEQTGVLFDKKVLIGMSALLLIGGLLLMFKKSKAVF